MAGIGYGGRITGIAAHPTDPNTIYIAAAGGGVWRTTDGGGNWTPLTDSQRTLSMGAIAIASSNPLVIYAGTGEANNAFDSNFGRGILTSTDGGTTWTLRAGPGNIFDRMTTSAIAVDPANANIAYAAMANFAVNGLEGATGIYKTTDGGATWTDTTSAITSSEPYSDVRVDPNTPATVYMAVGDPGGSAQNGVYKSTNGGGAWTPLSNGPTGTAAGRIAIAVSKSNPQVIYVAAHDPSTDGLYKLMRSDDGGATFTDLTGGAPDFLGFQGFFDIYLAVDPANSAIVYAAGDGGPNSFLRSTNSGASWTDIRRGGLPNSVSPHVDHHAVAFDVNGLLLDGDDGGIFRLDDPTTPAWSDLNGDLATIQFYGVGLHPSDPNTAIGGSQDNGTSLYSGSVVWTETDGGDGGFAKFSPTLSSRAYHVAPVDSLGPSRFFRRSDDGGNTWSSKTSGFVNTSAFAFYPPFVVDPNNGDRLLIGGDRVFETANAADSWAAISAPGVGGWTARTPIAAIGLAKSDVNTIYAATLGGSFFGTTDRGVTWTNTPIPGLFPNYVADIQVDPADSSTAYAVIAGFRDAGTVLKKTSGGSWTSITGNLPNMPVWSLQIAAGGVLYIGADDGVYSSTNGGASWSRFGNGLPEVQVFQIELNPSLGILGAATHGRGAWEIQTPLAFLAPDLTIYKTHTGRFTAGLAGVTYTITARNVGTVVTSGIVTVTDILPAALTATSIGGTGWNCTQPAGACTRSDALAPGATYPPITLTVNIAATAMGTLVNTATVAGGGETNTGNDTASDAVILTIGPPPAPILTSPANRATGTSLTPTLTWGASGGASSYDVYFDTSPQPLFARNTASLSYATRTLSPNTTYYWRVVARNSVGSASSLVWSFTTGPSLFIPITPCRIADTRTAVGPFGGPALAAQTSRDFAVSSSACNIPSTASAYSLNIAVVPPGPLGYLTVYPAGQPAPFVATLNSIDGRVKSNAAIVPAGTGGAISIFTTDAADVVIDINGYFVSNGNPAALAFYPLTPCRIADTRKPNGPLGGPGFAGGDVRTFPVLGSTCNIPALARAYALNFAAVPSGPLGYMTAWPTGKPQPFVASLNAPTGTVTANAVMVGAGTNGSVDVFALSATDLVIDITGYFAAPGAGGMALYNLSPCRVLDTRLPAGSTPFSGTIGVSVAGSPCGVPASARALVFNATVVPPGPLGYLTLWPQGQSQPPTATLNAEDGAVTNNMAIIPTTNGSVNVFALNPTHLVLDISAYFAP
jgi:photosystem II stability/assembly factor-like uncharacterized protein